MMAFQPLAFCLVTLLLLQSAAGSLYDELFSYTNLSRKKCLPPLHFLRKIQQQEAMRKLQDERPQEQKMAAFEEPERAQWPTQKSSNKKFASRNSYAPLLSVMRNTRLNFKANPSFEHNFLG